MAKLRMSDVRYDPEECAKSYEEIVRCAELQGEKIVKLRLRLSDVRCDQKEECVIVQGDFMELLRKENVRCESEKISEMLQGDCLEKSVIVNMKV